MKQKALIIDDEADIRELIAMSLDRIGLDTYTAANLVEARNLLDSYQFDVCLTDMKLPDGNGVEFVRYATRVQPNLPIAVITAHGNMDAAIEAMKNGAFDFVSKPVDLRLLRDLVAQAIKAKRKTEPASNAGSASEGGSVNDVSLNSAKTLHGLIGNSEANSTTGESDDHVTTGKAGLNSDSNPTNTRNDKRLQSLSSGHQANADHQRTGNLVGAERLIGESEPMQALKTMIVKVARTNAPVWITGESGTGKELIARLIHDNGPRACAPFVAINCGAIPTELMESEMFGHRKGSFTGAHSDNDGLFKRAEGGTLFLDEIAELPLHMQVKLLRTIQERKIRPVGAADEITTNVRILSASHKDLSVEVDGGRFRHDLYYRLNVICIRAPSLRQRSDDVVMIAQHALQHMAQAEGLHHSVTLTPKAEELLRNYSFPGNVRELENILERAVALSDSDQIDASDLNISATDTHRASSIQPVVGSIAANDRDEKQSILDMLAQTRWNRKATAEQLGMTYRQLRYRIKQYGIDDEKQSRSDL